MKKLLLLLFFALSLDAFSNNFKYIENDLCVFKENSIETGTSRFVDQTTSVVSITTTTPNVAEPSTNGFFIVNISNPVNTDTTVSYIVVGTATNGSDFVTIPLTVIIPANETSVTIPVIVIDDMLVEVSETVILTVVAVSNPSITIDNSPAIVTINDNDDSVVTVTGTTPTITEGQNGLFTVTLSNPVSIPIVCSYTITGTAINGVDYSNISNIIVIPAGQTSEIIPFSTLIDFNTCEQNETVVITLISTSYVATYVNSTPATVTIIDASPPSTLAATVTNQGNTTVVNATGGNPPYTYSVNGSSFFASNVFTNLFAGNNSFQVKDAGGCVVSVNSITSCGFQVNIVASLDIPVSTFTINVFHLPAIAINYSCTIDGVLLNYTGSQFTIPSNTLAPGNHIVVVTNPQNGCSVTTTFTSGTPNNGVLLSMSGTYNDYNNDGYTNVGDVINYQFTVNNPNNVAIDNVTVVNQQIAISGNPIVSLGAGMSDSTTFTGVHVITQQEINSGVVYGSAVVNAVFNNNPIVDDALVQINLNISRGFKLNAFIDSDGNGIQNGAEVNFSNGFFIAQLSGAVAQNIYSNNGVFYLYETNPTNSYNFSYNFQNSSSSCGSGYGISTSSYSNVTLSGTGITTYNFALTTAACVDLEVNIYGDSPRPGFSQYNKVLYRNNGNSTIASGTVTFARDNILSIISISQSGTTPTANGFSHNFTNLLPSEIRYIDVYLQVPVIPTVSLGQLVTNTANITIPVGDINVANNTSISSKVIIGSYDPNDKTESHGSKISQSTFTANDYLTYTIRFENTGTAEAINIKVNDVLDSKLDPTSIRMVDASHDYVLDRKGTNLEWRFAGINLPPSVVDTQIGHGYIVFQVKPKAGYLVGDSIPNFADIYFDFNPAIVTNTWTTEFVSALSNNKFAFQNLKIYPNPTTNILNISNTENIDNLELTNVLGQIILTQTVNDLQTKIDLSGLTDGVYFVKVIAGNGEETVKIVKQ